MKLKYLCSSFSTPLAQSEVKDEGLYKVYGASGLVGYLDTYSMSKPYLGIVKDGAGVGRVNCYNSNSSLLGTLAYIIPNERADINWLKYVITSLDLGKDVGKTTIPHIFFSEYGNRDVSHYVSVEQQRRLATFLDAECSRIDAVIEQTRASIEEYKKLKQSVITQAVTKGVRPNRRMKDSGDEWLGNIPTEWSCKKFKYIATVKSNLVAPDEYGDYPQVSPENIEKGSGRLLPCRTVAEVGVISWNHLFYKGQILYSKIRPKLNKVVIAPFDGLCSADMYPIETRLNERFFLYSMQSDAFLANIGLITEDRVKMPKINQEELGEIRFAVPPDDEQLEIVAHLDRRAAEIDGIITNKEQLMMELESYKKSLIYEYVTGKKEVT